MRDLTEEESTALAQFAPRVKGAIATAGSGAKAKLLGVELGTECQGEPSEAAKVVPAASRGHSRSHRSPAHPASHDVHSSV